MKKISLILSLVILIYTQAFANEINTIAVVDAGSSGTRMHVYQINNVNSGLPKLTEIYTKKVKPGLSSFAMNTSAAGKSLEPILVGTEQAIKAAGGSPSRTPLYIYATAGMRLLPESTQQAIYSNIRATLLNHAFRVNQARTIPGWEEGIFGWITINDLKGTFNEVSPHKTQGVLDLGGASAEITFHTDENNANNHNFTLAGKAYTVFAYSFLHLGVNDALVHLNEYGNLSSCFPSNYAYQVGEQRGMGHYNFATCLRETDREVANFKIPSITPTLNPKTVFTALSSFYYTFDFFKTNSSQLELKNAIQSVCQMDWAALKNKYPHVPEEYLSSYCFNGTFALSLLGPKGYGFNANHPQLKAENDIEGQDIDWTVGAALYLISGTGLQS